MRDRALFRVSDDAIAAGVPVRLRGCPFFIAASGSRRDLNRFLEQRYLGRWFSSETRMKAAGQAMIGKKPKRPASGSVEQQGQRVHNFLNWFDSQDERHWTAAVEDDIDRYAEAMETGAWSADGEPLATSTICQRQIDAIHFLEWAKERGLAPQFSVTEEEVYEVVSVKSGGKSVAKRKRFRVVRRPDPAVICFPTSSEVESHIDSVKDPAHQLGTKLVYRCGLRASEVINLRISDLPSASRRAGNQFFLSVLGKGRKRRNPEIDAEFLEEIRDFVEFERAIRAARASQRTDHLLLNQRGEPLTYHVFWEQFVSDSQFSPHLGRHWYAVNYLVKRWEAEQRRAAERGLLLANDQMPQVLSLDLIRLQQNLGHASLMTTFRYLVCLRQFTQNTDLHLKYQQKIGGDGAS
jgi:integrase